MSGHNRQARAGAKAARRRARQNADRTQRAQRRTDRAAQENEARAQFAQRLESEFIRSVGRPPQPQELDAFERLRPQTSGEWARMFTLLGLPGSVGRAVHEVGYVVWAETAHLFTTQEVDRFRAALDRHGGV